MHLYADTEFGKAVKELFARLNQIALVDGVDYEDGRFKAYIFGGAAVHIYTNSRSSHDVDVEFSAYLPAFKEEDVVVTFIDEAGDQQVLTFDDNFTSTLGLLHEDYLDDAVPFLTEKGNPLWVYLVSPVDLAVSKLGRFADHDFEDIKSLARSNLIDAANLKERAEFALVAYVGDTLRARTNIDQAIEALKKISK